MVVESVSPCSVVNPRTPLKLQLSTAATARSAASAVDTPLPAPPPKPLPPPLLPSASSSPLPPLLPVRRHLGVLQPLLPPLLLVLASADDTGSLPDGGFGWGGVEMGPATDDSDADEADGSHSCRLDGDVACSSSCELVAKDGRISTTLAACCSKCSKVTARLIPEQ